MKVNLHINSRLVKSVKIKSFNNWDEITKKKYNVWIIGHKDLFGKFAVKTWLVPMALIENPTNKEVNLNCNIYGGAKFE